MCHPHLLVVRGGNGIDISVLHSIANGAIWLLSFLVVYVLALLVVINPAFVDASVYKC